MKIIQTFWSGNKSDILHDSFGWYDASYHMQGWALSCQLLRRLYDDVELYTDEVGYDLLINQLQLPYTKVHIVLDGLNHYSSDVWALSKIKTYSLQTTPFIHIDGDVFLWKQFDQKLTNADLVSQNLEIDRQYFKEMWNQLENLLDYIPEEIQQKRQENPNIVSYNFGIFGGSDLNFIQEFCRRAFEFVDQNLASIDKIKDLNFNIFFEQYLFLCLLKGRQMSCYFSEIFDGANYKGFANFDDAPYERDYLHLMGNYKKNLEVCKKLSRQLAIEFPEQYLRCLEVSNSRRVKIFNALINNKSTRKNQITGSYSEYYQSTPYQERFSKTKRKLQKDFSYSDEKIDQAFVSKKQIEDTITKLNDLGTTKLYQDEVKIDAYLSSLMHLKFVDYSQWEYQQWKRYPSFIENMEKYEFMQVSEHTIIKEDFSLENNANEIFRLILPSANEPFYTEIILDELEQIIFKESVKGISIKQLLITMQDYFSDEDLKNNISGYQKLIRTTVKRLTYRGVLELIHEDKNILSRGIDTNLECL